MVRGVLEVLHLVVLISEGIIIIRSDHLRILVMVGAQVYLDRNGIANTTTSSLVKTLCCRVEA